MADKLDMVLQAVADSANESVDFAAIRQAVLDADRLRRARFRRAVRIAGIAACFVALAGAGSFMLANGGMGSASEESTFDAAAAAASEDTPTAAAAPAVPAPAAYDGEIMESAAEEPAAEEAQDAGAGMERAKGAPDSDEPMIAFAAPAEEGDTMSGAVTENDGTADYEYADLSDDTALVLAAADYEETTIDAGEGVSPEAVMAAIPDASAGFAGGVVEDALSVGVARAAYIDGRAIALWRISDLEYIVVCVHGISAESLLEQLSELRPA